MPKVPAPRTLEEADKQYFTGRYVEISAEYSGSGNYWKYTCKKCGAMFEEDRQGRMWHIIEHERVIIIE